MAPPKPCAFWPLTIVAGVNNRVDFKIGASSLQALVGAGVYYRAIDIAQAVAASMDAASTAGGFPTHAHWTYGVLSTGRVRIGNSSGLAVTYTLAFSTGAGAAVSLRDVLGFGAVDAAFTSPGTPFVDSANQHQNGWYADDPVQDDTGDLPGYERAQGVALGGRLKGLTFATRYQRNVRLGFLEAWKVWKVSEGSTHLNESLQRLFDDGWARFRWWPDQADGATSTDYALALDTAKALPRERLGPGAPLYSLTLKFLKYV